MLILEAGKDTHTLPVEQDCSFGTVTTDIFDPYHNRGVVSESRFSDVMRQ
jgi:hypothetical protein